MMMAIALFLWGYMLYADEHVVVVVCREADGLTDVFMHVVVDI